MLRIRKTGSVAGGFEHKLILKRFKLLPTSVKLIGVGDFLRSIVGVGGYGGGSGSRSGSGGGSGTGSEAIHDPLGVY